MCLARRYDFFLPLYVCIVLCVFPDGKVDGYTLPSKRGSNVRVGEKPVSFELNEEAVPGEIEIVAEGSGEVVGTMESHRFRF